MPDEIEVEGSWEDVGIKVHGVLAPEGVRTRDRRMIAEGALWWAEDQSLPLLWQEKTGMGHDDAVTVGSITFIERRGNLIVWEGELLDTEEADKMASMIAQGAQRSMSVDVLETTGEMRDKEGKVVGPDYVFEEDADEDDFTSTVTHGELAGATVVVFGAFREAYIALGPLDSEATDYEDVDDEEIEALVASASFDDTFVSVAPGQTEDGPGWLTHPVDTDRLRDYWTKGPGAAKIAWGTAGDFRRCRALLAPYIKPQYLSGYCANRHKDALGTWPGRHSVEPEVAMGVEPVVLVASGRSAEDPPPIEWFSDPKLVGPSPITVTEDGRVYGHAATWETCHLSFPGECVTPPHSPTDYAYFCNKAVRVKDGDEIKQVRCGVLTLGGGHADERLGFRGALEHYDNTGCAVARVEAGEDEWGIWVAGAVRPGTTQEQIDDLRASVLSGDWREIGGQLDFIAALAVNVGGFSIPRYRETADGVVALVAAGAVPRGDNTESFVSSLAEKVADEMERRNAARAAEQAALEKLSAIRTKHAQKRIAAIREKRTV